MEKFVIKGGRKLKGTIRVNGAKNAALKMLAASLLTDQPWTISNVPAIEDIFWMIELLKGVGVRVEKLRNLAPKDLGVKLLNQKNRTYTLQAQNIISTQIDRQIGQKLKGSILMAGPLLARKGRVKFPCPGGCVIGQRPRDIFLDGFQSFGAKIEVNRKGYSLSAKKLKGTKFIFPIISVTATEAMILTAVLAQGKTILKNAACEPEISALVNFLNQCGAKIRGAGTPFIEIEGVKSLRSGQCRIMPDRIEAGSFIILGLATQSPIKISHCHPEHLEVLLFLLNKAGADLKIGKNYVLIKSIRPLRAVNIRTHEYPGLATDLQAPLTILMTQAQGLSLIHETIFEGRLFYTDILNQMGAKIIMCDPHRVLVQGPSKLFGRRMISPDIRAGIALVIAALTAKGQSVIENVYQIDRGYERIEERLQKLGAEIKRVV